MSLQEKKALFNLITTVLIMGGYIFYTFELHGEENLARVNDIQFWGEFMLVMVGVTIVLKIVSYIVFSIFMKSIHKNEDLEFMDDYDKQIEMRSDHNSNYLFMISFVFAMVPIAMGRPVSYMFIILLSGGFSSGILSDILKLYYYKKGIKL